MIPCSNNKNPLQPSGTSQAERLLPALDAGYVSVDERDYDDWIVFANSFAAFLNFFDGKNIMAAGDWTPFFTNDISSVLGAISVQEIDTYKQDINERFKFLKSDENELNDIGLKTKFNELFSALFTLSKAMDDYYDKLPEAVSLKVTLLNTIKSKLAPALNRLIGYYIAAETEGLINKAGFGNWRILNRNIIDAGEFKTGNQILNKRWITTTETDWVTYFNNIDPEESIFKNQVQIPGREVFLSIEHAANHNLFSSIFDQYLFAYTKFVNDAGAELIKTLGEWDSHQPHYALFLAFLKLFKFAQQQINTITKRHLDFYYEGVLRLSPKPAEPNKVHVLGELAKQVESFLLTKETELKAGKDSIGKDVIYTLDNDAVFNKAKVALLKNVYKGSGADSVKTGNTITINNKGRLFAAPVSNSDDGTGTALTGANKEWHPYVHKVYAEASLTKIALPAAQIGFAVASRYLYLTEGEREVRVKFQTGSATIFTGVNIECWLTTAKGWYRLKTLENNVTLLNTSADSGEIHFKLQGDEPAITDYIVKVHGGNYNCDVPILKVYLLQDEKMPYQYDTLRDITILKVEIVVGSGTSNNKGIKSLFLANHTGILDGSKAFMPFGQQPDKDAALIIGSKEIFYKKNCTINLNIEWAALPNSPNDIKYSASGATEPDLPKVKVQFLQKGIWTGTDEKNLFVNSNAEVQIPGISLPESTIKKDTERETYAYNSASTNGFVRLVLKEDFGFKKYISDLSIYLLEKNPDITPKTVTNKPNEPYTPLMQSLYLSYTAHQSVDLTKTKKEDFDESEIRFFHIYPFGEAAQHKYLDAENDVFLLPQFKHTEPGTDITDNDKDVVFHHNGEFYIGIENLQPKESVNILFQVLEGSTDPQMAKPANHIHWNIMGNNKWLEFSGQGVTDNTLALLQSGIISFAIPAEATTNNTLLPSGYIWIRAAISETTAMVGNVKTIVDINTAESVCKLLTIDAQAAVATFAPNNNADDFLNTALAAGTVTKLKTPDAAIKKITQPYASFGGRTKESTNHFYLRVSEHLRHKARAINIWDYEHIILENFPEIYKVKCLNHTGLVTDDSNGKEYTNELMPGHVLIITIPILINRNDANTLKPFTNQGTLTKIETYLSSRISCFVTLKARQPLFEEINMKFNLKLRPQYMDFVFYSGMLQDAITRYLTPWAYNDNKDIQFGGKIYKSSIINFIEDQYYVDYITDVEMLLTIDETSPGQKDAEVAIASTVRSILVSAPPSKHIITQIVDEAAPENKECVDLRAV